MARTDLEVLADLEATAAALAPVNERRAELYARRLELYREARAMDPPITQSRIAAAAQVSEVAVIRQLKSVDSSGA